MHQNPDSFLMCSFVVHKSAVQADTVQTLVDAILRSDIDQNSSFSEREINILYMRLKNLPGIQVNENALKRTVGEKSFSITNVFSMVKDMELEESVVPEGDRVFTFEEV